MGIGSHRAHLFAAIGISSIILVACVIMLAFPLKGLENGFPPFSCLFEVSSSISLACTKSCALFLSDEQFSIESPGFSQWNSQCAVATYYLGHGGLRGGKWIGVMRWFSTSLGNNSPYEGKIKSNRILSLLAFGPFVWFFELLDRLLGMDVFVWASVITRMCIGGRKLRQ